MPLDFILMLTEHDATVPDAKHRLEAALAGGARHIGFKDVGLPENELRGLATTIRDAGAVSYLEVVATDQDSELRSVQAALDYNVDCVLGGVHPETIGPMLADHPIRYVPFAGRITNDPVSLEGSVEEIIADAVRVAAIDGVDGINLLAHRFTGDAAVTGDALIASVCAEVKKPVLVSGSINSGERIKALSKGGAVGFTVGTAAFNDVFDPSSPGLTEQVRAIFALARKYAPLNRRPRTIALVAHDGRKSTMLAWVGRHAKLLSAHTVVCTGTTGRLIAEAHPDLTVKRLHSGPRGGDQQLGAMIVAGEIEALIFFTDPLSPQAHDVDVKALMRIAILQDLPSAYNPATADRLVEAGLLDVALE